MFFLSGGTGLAYQVIWFKRFAHVWGSSSLAFASVGGSFLFGLGMGAYLIGRYADSFDRPLRWYGICELAIGAVGTGRARWKFMALSAFGRLLCASAGRAAGAVSVAVLRHAAGRRAAVRADGGNAAAVDPRADGTRRRTRPGDRLAVRHQHLWRRSGLLSDWFPFAARCSDWLGPIVWRRA